MMGYINPRERLELPPGSAPPLVLDVLVTPPRNEVAGGVVERPARVEQYIILSALPDELRSRVVTAVMALQAGL